jgi:hypothetical protein
MRKHVSVLALVALALGLAGCGNSESSGGTGNTGPGSTGSDTTGPGDTGSSRGDSDLSKLLAKTKDAKFKVTYQSGEDTPFTIAQDPPRFSYVNGDSSTYVLADGSAVSCNGTGSSATCTAMPGSGDSIKQGLNAAFGSIGALFLSEAGKGIPGLAGIKTTDASIAGRDAACATIDGSTLGALGAAIKGSYSVCIDTETGVMLESKADDGNGTTSDLKATAFGAPSDSDLTPPATPNTIPGLTTTS